jgi:peptidyl-prolyl cis-trans isomerase B (cyclophilin B)
MSSPGLPPRNRWPFIAAVLVVILVGVVSAAIGFDRVAGRNSEAGVPSSAPTTTPTPAPTPSPTPAPTPTPSPVAFADCSTATFGAALPPLNPPADVHKYPAAPAMTIDTTKLYQATVLTAKGTIVLCLQPELAPDTVNNFVTLARNHFYDGLTFHRVVADFVVQGGDPQGTGNGGPGYQFNDEPVRQSYVAGAVAMANSGKNTNGSQFFICTADDTTKLQPLYNLFGKVQSGLDVAVKIAQGDTMTSVTVAQQQ